MRKRTFELLFASLIVFGGCRTDKYSYQEYRSMELEALEAYRGRPALEAASAMKRLYDYGEALCGKERRPNASSALAIIAARQAFLFDHLGSPQSVESALAKCRLHLKDITVRGERDSSQGRLDAFLCFVADLDRGIGARWGPESSLVRRGVQLSAASAVAVASPRITEHDCRSTNATVVEP